MNINLSPLPIDLNIIFAGKVVATGIRKGTSLKEVLVVDDCIGMVARSLASGSGFGLASGRGLGALDYLSMQSMSITGTIL